MSRRVTIRDAAQIMGVSRKTVERYIHIGKLSATREGNRYLVDLPDDAETMVRSKASGATETRLAAALAELEAVKAERDRLVNEREDMSRQITNLTAALFQMTQRALPEPRGPGLWTRIKNWWGHREQSEG